MMSQPITAEPAIRRADILLLGRGGMGEVHLATRAPAGRRVRLVVVKRPHDVLRKDPRLMTMFEREVAIALLLSHPNLVRGLESGVEEGVPFLAMEYVAGTSLYNLGRRAGLWHGLALHVHLRILADACAGLHHLHELRDGEGRPLGLVHRDVSPQNIVVSHSGRVKVCDYGLTRAEVECHSLVSGRITYMAPEVLGGHSFDRRADVYAMGALLWQAATGRRLFAGNTETKAFATLTGVGAPSVLSVDPSVPAELSAIIERALSLDVAKRTPSMEVLRLELEAFLAHTVPTSTRDVRACMRRLFSSDRRRTNRAIVGKLRALGALAPRVVTNVVQTAPPIALAPKDMPTQSQTATQSHTATPTPAPMLTPKSAQRGEARASYAIAIAALVLAAALTLFAHPPAVPLPASAQSPAAALIKLAACNAPDCR